jgi:hypothetical protein
MSMDPVQYPQSPYSQQPYPPPYEQPPAYDQPPGYDQASAYSYPPPNAYQGYAGPMPPKTSGMAIASLVLSLLGLFPLYLIGPILGVIFGHMALGDIKRSGGAVEGQGLAIAGLVAGYVMLGFSLLVACFFLLIVLAVLNGPTTTGFMAPGISH